MLLFYNENENMNNLFLSYPNDNNFLITNLKENSNESIYNGRWGKEEQKRFAEAVFKYGNNWKKIQGYISSRNITQVRSYAQKFLMKLKENELIKDKGLDNNLSWTKAMKFLSKNLTKEEWQKKIIFNRTEWSKEK